ncbi:GNAT family N-acetyltransferase [Corynebacterium sp. USCH3]|uniref:GNAT family N-acetyltransferase n=1 Tax=Corynebacterium sp. USCH3 TaxID=3024840 RepID=UPI0030A82B18
MFPEEDLHPARRACADDIPAIRELERRAGELFRSVGLDSIADDDPPDAAELALSVDDGRVLVVDADDVTAAAPLAAWLWTGSADGDLLIEQVSVAPEYRGRRLGTTLVALAVTLARRRGCPGVCLTTFDEIPWNGPLYRRLGFLRLDPDDLGPDLRSIRDAECAAGLDVAPRSAYRRNV